MLRKMEDKRRRGQQRVRRLDSITNSVDTNVSKFWETVEHRRAQQGAAVHGVTKSWTQLSYWTTKTSTKNVLKSFYCYK